MKKLVILLAVIFSVASCGKEEFYSCDIDVNTWAKSNVAEIQQMSREDFLVIGDLVYQRAVYNAFTSTQRQALWVGKMKEVLKLDWSEQERQHIQSMLKLIEVNSFIFSKGQDSGAVDEMELAIYKWTEYAQEELGWDKKLLYALIATPQVMNVKKEIDPNLKSPPSLKSGSEGGGQPVCNCSLDFDLCSVGPIGSARCRGWDCFRTDWGCGPLWLNDCSGVCIV